MKNITGTWKLLSFEIVKENNISLKPFGDNVNGLVIYHENGYMSGIISGEGRFNVSSTATMGLSEKERLNISNTFIAYAGKYQIKEDIIIHNVQVSFIPNLTNETSHKNLFKLNGNCLTTISKPQSINKGNSSIILNWEKVS